MPAGAAGPIACAGDVPPAAAPVDAFGVLPAVAPLGEPVFVAAPEAATGVAGVALAGGGDAAGVDADGVDADGVDVDSVDPAGVEVDGGVAGVGDIATVVPADEPFAAVADAPAALPDVPDDDDAVAGGGAPGAAAPSEPSGAPISCAIAAENPPAEPRFVPDSATFVAPLPPVPAPLPVFWQAASAINASAWLSFTPSRDTRSATRLPLADADARKRFERRLVMSRRS